MAGLAVLAVLAAAIASGVPTAATADTAAGSYTNPVYGRDAPDPYILRVGNDYYAYSTNTGGENVPVLHSTDLAHWDHSGDAMPHLATWVGPGHTWAPSVLATNGRYVL